jgi:hypothetical protein
MSAVTHYAFVDESGTAAPFSGSRFFVVALLCVTSPRAIELYIKRAHKKYGTSLRSGEMKASSSQHKVVERLLQDIAQEAVAIMSIIVDKREIVRPPKDIEDIYRQAASEVVRQAVSQWPRLDIYLDKRYTTKRLRYQLEIKIREKIAGLTREVVIIRQEDSIACKELQAVDHVAWAFFQKYERGEERFYQHIVDSVVMEDVLKRQLW